MLDIIPHIQYLVSRKDCVVLPGWGAFIANHVNAFVADGIMYPPARSLAFNPDINHDDGLIVASVVRRHGIRFSAAKAAVASAVEQLRNLYDIAGYVTIPRIGTLRRDENGKTIFSPVNDSVASASFMSLPSFAVTEQKPQSVKVGEKITALSGIRTFGKIAASVAILIGLAITLSTPVIVDRSRNQFASMPAPAITPAKSITLHAPAEPQVLYIAKPDAETATEPAVSFYLIVSSHNSAAEANRFIAAHPGENLTVFESDNRFRIVAATAPSFNRAQQIKADSQFAARYPDAWILKK
ncbi:MAG: hypothetical protein K2K52_02045 [Paramuribaculum sp.]|nr:hypothetical protein [Paramuribaculum sp.]MDE6459602.1 hypothetical protein [Paramuribaculum sp.]